jgi:undecaprenyl-diphosphatase
MAAATKHSETLARSVQSFLPMPQTAWATTATAASFNPCSQPASWRSPKEATPSAKPSIKSADGSVKQQEATSAPSSPARSMPRPRAFVDIIQSGTVLAVMVYFRGDLWRIARGTSVAVLAGRPMSTQDARLGWYIVLGTIPAAVIGKALEHRIEALGNWVIAASLLFLGLVLLAAERLARHERQLEEVGARDAVLVGLAQAWALVPGSSRSGCTLTMGMMLGFTREAAARFSFLLSVPIVLGAGIYKLQKTLPVIRASADWQLGTLIGTVVSFVAGYLVIGWLLGWLRTRKTYVFVVWRLLASIAMAGMIAAGVLPR